MEKKKGDLRSVATVLQSLFKDGKQPLSDQFMRWKLWSQWEQVVGPQIAKYSQPVAFQRNQLWIQVDSSARVQEMRFFAAEFIRKINQFMGRPWVKFIHFTLDRKSVPAGGEFQEEVQNLIQQINVED